MVGFAIIIPNVEGPARYVSIAPLPVSRRSSSVSSEGGVHGTYE
jgi:hypothetical protein